MRTAATVLFAGGLALVAAPAIANARTHDFGPHTKAQVYSICDAEHGKRTAGTGKWGCEATYWTIACITNGKSCSIELLRKLPADVAGPTTIHHTTTTGTGGTTGGTGLSGNGGLGAAGGKMGGGTTGAISPH